MSKASNAAAAAAVAAETAATAAIAPAPSVEAPPASPGAANVELGVLRQVPMTVQVEVGRTSITLGEILDELEVGVGVAAVCRYKGKEYKIDVTSLEWPKKKPEGFEWIEAYQHWYSTLG